MPRFAANLNMLFTDVPYMERFAQARAVGFTAVEAGFVPADPLFPYEYDVAAAAAELRRLGLQQVLINVPLGDRTKGDRGIAAHPARREEFREGISHALDAARHLDCRQVNCLVGLRDEAIPYAEQWTCLVDNLRTAARTFDGARIILTVEPLNTYDLPKFLLARTAEAIRLLAEVGAPNLRVQYDVYHMQKMEGNIVNTLREHLPRIGHVQIADPPGRHQPGTGELNFTTILGALDAADYPGYVGLEYKPLGSTRESLLWVTSMGYTFG